MTTLRKQWAARAKARTLISPVDMSRFPDEPPAFVRRPTAAQLLAWEAGKNGDGANQDNRTSLIQLCICDEAGEPLLDAAQIDALPYDLYGHFAELAGSAISGGVATEGAEGKEETSGSPSAG